MNKEIMEIIQPYMDKTLSFGCLVKTNIQAKNFGDANAIVPYYEEIKSELPGNNMIKVMYGNQRFIVSKYDIIGHYDITAILKYIFLKGVCERILYDPMFDNASIHCEWRSGYDNPQFIIPNKPLHLYTEEEQTNLLELLKKLGSNN